MYKILVWSFQDQANQWIMIKLRYSFPFWLQVTCEFLKGKCKRRKKLQTEEYQGDKSADVEIESDGSNSAGLKEEKMFEQNENALNESEETQQEDERDDGLEVSSFESLVNQGDKNASTKEEKLVKVSQDTDEDTRSVIEKRKLDKLDNENLDDALGDKTSKVCSKSFNITNVEVEHVDSDCDVTGDGISEKQPDVEENKNEPEKVISGKY